MTIALPKATKHVIPLSAYLSSSDLQLMGIWAWLREFIDLLSPIFPQVNVIEPGFPVDRLAHILQRTVECGPLDAYPAAVAYPGACCPAAPGPPSI